MYTVEIAIYKFDQLVKTVKCVVTAAQLAVVRYVYGTKNVSICL